MSFPNRYQVAAALVCLNLIGTAALATYAYRTSRESLEQQATSGVDLAARAREEAILRLLQNRRARLEAFLISLESLCGERGPSGRFGWERECVHVAVSGFETSERVTAIDLRYRGRRLASNGSWPADAAQLPPDQIAAIDEITRHDYTIGSSRGLLTARVRVPLDDVSAIVDDRSGLEPSGGILLASRDGAVLLASRGARRLPARLPDALSPCLAGVTGHLRGDLAGADVISAFRPLPPAMGGGCLVAAVEYADILVPIQHLGRRVAIASMVFVLFGTGIALVLARREHVARLEAEAANRTKDDFLAMLSHELRTPLTAILGWSSLMLGRRGDHPLAMRALDAIERSARTQARLIDDLLDVSRIVSGKLRVNLSGDVAIDAIVAAAVEAARPAADAKRLTIQMHVEPGSYHVMGDAERLQQVVGNLLSNAVRYTPADGRIAVTVAATHDEIEVRVEDTGIGIEPGFLPHVFERFRQADSGRTTRSYGGLGLGLAIARHLVERHGGTIHAESPGPGRGSTFSVRLPRRAVGDAPTTRIEPVRDRSVPPLLEGTRVLVVDDDGETREVVRAILEGAGARVATAASAEATRAVLRHTRPDVLIADIGMPQEDGYSLIRSVRAGGPELRSDLPAIALTAHVRPEDVEEAISSGFQAHLAKPVDPSKLLAAVASTVARHWSN